MVVYYNGQTYLYNQVCKNILLKSLVKTFKLVSTNKILTKRDIDEIIKRYDTKLIVRLKHGFAILEVESLSYIVLSETYKYSYNCSDSPDRYICFPETIVGWHSREFLCMKDLRDPYYLAYIRNVSCTTLSIEDLMSVLESNNKIRLVLSTQRGLIIN